MMYVELVNIILLEGMSRSWLSKMPRDRAVKFVQDVYGKTKGALSKQTQRHNVKNTLYHFTPIKNVENIRKKGILPYKHGKKNNYGSKIKYGPSVFMTNKPNLWEKDMRDKGLARITVSTNKHLYTAEAGKAAGDMRIGKKAKGFRHEPKMDFRTDRQRISPKEIKKIETWKSYDKRYPQYGEMIDA